MRKDIFTTIKISPFKLDLIVCLLDKESDIIKQLNKKKNKHISDWVKKIVEDYLKDNYGILAHLYDLPQKINQYFGNVVLNFGVFSDPDTEEEPELYVEVETSLSPEEANQKLSLINKEWLFSSEDSDLISLNITLKFS